MAQFELALLGPPRVYAQGEPVRLATRKAQALLIILAVEAIPISRDKLIDLLWADSDLARGQVSLRTTLTQVRRGLNERVTYALAHAPATRPLISAETGTLAINPAADCHIDVRLLDKAYTLSRSFKTGTVSSREVRPLLEQAVAAYAGDFLDGFSSGDSPNFDDWATVQREKWHLRFSAVLDRLSQLQFEGGEFAVGIDTTTRWIRHDAFNEIAHRRLMQLHLAAGNHAGALQAYEACQTILAGELNANPSPETEALGQRVRAQTLPAAAPTEAVRAPAQPRMPAMALIGRGAEHRQLVQVYREVGNGPPQAIVIRGEPGIGKTRLAQEFLGWTTAQGAVVMQAAAYELMVNLPYQVWADAIRNQLSLAHGRAALGKLERHEQAALSQVLPELVKTNATLPSSTTSAGTEVGQNRSQLFEAVFGFVQQLSPPTPPTHHQAIGLRATPRILFLDDAQWIDAASLDVLQYLAHRCVEAGVPMMMVMTLRQEAADAFEPALIALRRHMPVTPMTLNPLSRADSERLVRALVTQRFNQASHQSEPAGPDTGADLKDRHAQQVDRFAQTLFEETAGHPLYLLETFKALVESRPLGTDEAPTEAELAGWQRALEGWLVPGVKEVIQARLKRVSPPALALLNAVAVLGQRNDFEACYQTANLTEDVALGVLDEGTSRGLLRESANGVISFTHDKIREVVVAGLSASRRRSLHRRSAETLERLHPDRLDDFAPLIAQHFDAVNDSRALAYFQRAGHAAAKVYAYHEAATHFGRAIQWMVSDTADWAGERGAPDAERRALIAELHFKQASMHIQRATFAAAVETIGQLAELARRWQDAGLEQQTHIWLATTVSVPGPHMQLDRAAQLAEHILQQVRGAQTRGAQTRAARRDPPSIQAEIQAVRTLMRVALWGTQFDLARQHGQATLNLLGVSNDDTLRAYVLTDLTMIEWCRNHFEAAKRYQAEAIALWRALDRPALIVSSLGQACMIAVSCGEFEAAIAHAQEATKLSRHIDHTGRLALSQVRAAPAYFELGQADAAIAMLKDVLQASQAEQQDLTTLWSGVELARIYSLQGRGPEGLEVAQMAYDTATHGFAEWQLLIIPSLVSLHILQQDLAQGDAWLGRGRTRMAARTPWPAVQILLDAAEAELALAQGQSTRAVGLSARCVLACREQGWRQELPRLLLLEGRALQALGRLDEAMQTLQAASDEAVATNAQWSFEQIEKERRAIKTALVSN